MRINKFVAQATGMSRRSADKVIAESRVTIDGRTAEAGDQTKDEADIRLDGKPLRLPGQATTIMLNKPVGYVCSRDGQGSATIYDLLPAQYRNLKPVGRLDKDSSGLLLITNDGDLANQLTHPRYAKEKVYAIKLDKTLPPEDQTKIQQGVELEDGLSKLSLNALNDSGQSWQVTMAEGRNRQIRRTFAAHGYEVTRLHRIRFGDYRLASLKSGGWSTLAAASSRPGSPNGAASAN